MKSYLFELIKTEKLQKTTDLLLALCVPLKLGLWFTFAKAGLLEYPAMFLIGMLFCLTELVQVWFVPVPRENLKKIFQIVPVGSTFQYGLTSIGLSIIGTSLAFIVVHLEVPFVLLLAQVFLREKSGKQRLFDMFISFAGIVLITGHPNLQGKLLVMFLTVRDVVMWALGQIMIKCLKNP